ncbi:TetM/TetW/TetO/TetS family tetracycline resistance ribosomal protection protein [Clostridium aestuarii]|uniref:TetM/TetW/TetO/TetS family tetracycline resistance ribosomal protection protein n=1 Tax=Clostridium aestuarii TaxID=338193 RepID=A0ABT4CWN8_9CLOT|nr:TetM/TetW/TetO/TetS family tetracycline resistance ribosomal protection protein [Clostridium aestuarii]MCY6483376.1 TetM/TetW/TetO/TetS family tetracycline resistance ribosomal protection protein [Clostridium aestuarii]
MKNIRNIGLVAHVDAGKTTTTEQMMYLSGNIMKLGSVDKGSSQMDYDEIEKQRGITIFAEQTTLNWKDTKINIIDTPGHIDFLSELERALKALDASILIISAVEGVQSYTETIWQLLRKYKIPTLIFINKLDRVGADLDRVYKEIEENITSDFLPLYKCYNLEKDFNKFVDLINDKMYIWNSDDAFKFSIQDKKETYDKIKLIEKLADKDDNILEKYLEGESISNEEIIKCIRFNVDTCSVYPVIVGSSIKGIGIKNLLDLVVDILPDNKGNDEEDFSGIIYKIKIDDSIGKLCYVKVLDGIVKVRDTIFNEFGEEEKVTQIRKYNGKKYNSVEKLTSGEIGVLCGIRKGRVGERLGLKKENKEEESKSVLTCRVIPKDESDIAELLKSIEILNEEDPILSMQWDTDKKQININVMGFVQMEVLRQLIKDRFNIEVEIEKPKVKYLETITTKSTGFCHFEPKKHYAEVEVEIEPNKRGQGVKFVSNLSLDVLPLQYQNNIEKAVYEGVKHGGLIGSSVTDITVKLISAKYHLEHTHGGDFRIAAIRAVQQALSNNSSILLEPIYKYKIIVEKDFSGRVMSDILRMNGNFDEPVILGDKVVITGEVPVYEAMYYSAELASASSGKAVVSMLFSSYTECHNEEEILANSENIVKKDETLYNGISLFREKRKMKKVK